LHRSLIRSHHHTAVDFIGQVKTKKERETRESRAPPSKGNTCCLKINTTQWWWWWSRW